MVLNINIVLLFDVNIFIAIPSPPVVADHDINRYNEYDNLPFILFLYT